MVWSEQIGSSVTVPSDWTPGDTRNHMTIGEDVPAEIADHFTAVFSWWSGGFSGNPDQDFPNGFKYWALGISKSGNLELIACYYVVSSPQGGGYAYYRQTLLSSAPPVGVDNPPVLSLGYVPGYGTYGEGSVKLVSQAFSPIYQTGPLIPGPRPTGYVGPILGPGFVQYGGSYEQLSFSLMPDGKVYYSGLIKNVYGTTLTSTAIIVDGLPSWAIPKAPIITDQEIDPSVSARIRVDINTDGLMRLIGVPSIPNGVWVQMHGEYYPNNA